MRSRPRVSASRLTPTCSTRASSSGSPPAKTLAPHPPRRRQFRRRTSAPRRLRCPRPFLLRLRPPIPLPPADRPPPSLAMSTTNTRSFADRALLSLGATLALSALAFGCRAKADAKEAPPPPPPVAASTVAVTTVEAPRTLRLTGALRGERETDLAANVAGRVTSMKLERGQRVAKGEVIATVDVSSAALALAEARVAVQTSKTQEAINQADCARYERLKASGAVTELEYDQVTAKCKT